MAKKTVDVRADDEPRFTRSEIARRSGYSTTTILDLEAAGLLKPLRGPGGWRLYSEADVAMLLKRRERIAQRQALFSE
jgi:DNA-binding transcriptional MerR regulator